MLIKIDEDKYLIDFPSDFKIASGTMPNILSDGVLFFYSFDDNEYEIEPTNSKKELEEKLYDCFSSDPDGAIAWIPLIHVNSFLTFTKKFLIEKNKEDKLNFTNGSISEGFAFFNHKDGLLVEMLDPECFTEVFRILIKDFMKQENIKLSVNSSLDLSEFFYFEGYHLFSNLSEETEENSKIFNLLKLFKS